MELIGISSILEVLIPSDWNMRKIKYIFRIQKDIAGEEGHTVLSI